MKIAKSTVPSFIPIKLEITIETKEEFDVLEELSGRDVSISEYLYEGSLNANRVLLHSILQKIYKTLTA